MWLCGAVVRALDLRLEIPGSIPAAALSSATLGQLLARIASITNEYNLVLQHKLGSKQAHRSTHWSHVHGLQLLQGATESEISITKLLRKDFTF